VEQPEALEIGAILAIEDATEFAIALGNLVCQRAYTLGFDSLSAAERVAFCIDELEREVANGGFHQYFVNAGANYAREAQAALVAIGAPAMAALLAQAMDHFPSPGPPADQEARCALLEAMGDEAFEAFAPLDEAFCAYPDDLTALLRRFATAHRDEFHPPLATRSM
jgi:Domain of unknown function (DUF4375)